MEKGERKKKDNAKRHKFLLTFFDQGGDHYEEKEVNGFWLIKQFNKNTDSWQVAIYTSESYKKKKEYLESSRLF